MQIRLNHNYKPFSPITVVLLRIISGLGFVRTFFFFFLNTPDLLLVINGFGQSSPSLPAGGATQLHSASHWLFNSEAAPCTGLEHLFPKMENEQ